VSSSLLFRAPRVATFRDDGVRRSLESSVFRSPRESSSSTAIRKERATSGRDSKFRNEELDSTRLDSTRLDARERDPRRTPSVTSTSMTRRGGSVFNPGSTRRARERPSSNAVRNLNLDARGSSIYVCARSSHRELGEDGIFNPPPDRDRRLDHFLPLRPGRFLRFIAFRNGNLDDARRSSIYVYACSLGTPFRGDSRNTSTPSRLFESLLSHYGIVPRIPFPQSRVLIGTRRGESVFNPGSDERIRSSPPLASFGFRAATVPVVAFFFFSFVSRGYFEPRP